MWTPSSWHVLKSQSPRRKAVFSINHTVCTNSLGPANHPHQSGSRGNLPKSKFPNTSLRPASQASLSRGSSVRPTLPYGPELWLRALCPEGQEEMRVAL